MRRRGIAGSAQRRGFPASRATDYGAPSPEELAHAKRRAIALVERELEGEPNMLTMRELAPVEDSDSTGLLTVTHDGMTTQYRAVAAHFEDVTTFFPVLGEYEVWQLINLTGDTHPIHVHLDPFQILSRRPIRYEIAEGGIEDMAFTAAVTLGHDPADQLAHAIDDNERGLNAPVRCNPHNVAAIAVPFTNTNAPP